MIKTFFRSGIVRAATALFCTAAPPAVFAASGKVPPFLPCGDILACSRPDSNGVRFHDYSGCNADAAGSRK